jgi:hypothetical protein
MWPRVLLVAVLFAGLVAGTAPQLAGRAFAAGSSGRRRGRKAPVEANPVLAPFVFIVLAAFAIALSFPAVAILKIICGFFSAGCRERSTSSWRRRSAVGFCLRRRVRPLAVSCAGEPPRPTGWPRNSSAGHSPIFLPCGWLPSFRSPSSASRRPCSRSGCGRSSLQPSLACCPARFVTLAWAGAGGGAGDGEGAGRRVQLSDLVTTEITLALTALTLVAVLAAIVRKVRGPRSS